MDHDDAESRDAEADFLHVALRSSMGPGDDAQEEPQDHHDPDGLQQVVAQQPEGATEALFALWDQLKSWDAFQTNTEFFAIANHAKLLGSD